MLEDLEAERLKGFNHNLLVAATGTGKTVIAALDYKRLCEAAGRDLKLLFVAHRQEILKQAMRTYRDVMQDGAFGELYVGEHKPTAVEAHLRLRPVAVVPRHRQAGTGLLRRRRHR